MHVELGWSRVSGTSNQRVPRKWRVIEPPAAATRSAELTPPGGPDSGLPTWTAERGDIEGGWAHSASFSHADRRRKGHL